MKKLIALFLILALAFGMAACDSNADNQKPDQDTKPADSAQDAPVQDKEAPAELPYEGVTLTVGMAPLKSADADMAFWNEHLAKFTAETGAKVEVTVNDWSELQPKYLTGFMSDNAYDIFYAWPSMLPEFIDAGFIEDLTPYYTEEEIADEFFWNSCTYNDGKTYGVAFVGGTGYRCYVYNMDILAECGVTELPTTWDELLAVCETIHTARPDLYTFLGPLAGNTRCIDHMILQFNAQAGGTMVNEDMTAMTLNTPEMKKAFELELEMMEKGYLSADALGLSSENTTALFAEGKVAICVTDSPQIHFADVDFAWAASTDMSDVTAASFNPVDILALNAACENKQAAIDLIKFMNSTDVRDAYNNEITQSGKLRASDNEPVVDPHVADVWAHPERSFATPMAKLPATWLDLLISTQQLILSGEVTVDEGLANLQANIDAAMAE